LSNYYLKAKSFETVSRSAEEIVDSIAEINRSIDIMLESLPKN
jgi:hypothetical protein